MGCRGIRGATTVERDDAELIHAATRELLRAMVDANAVRVEDIASAIFTASPDLRSAFPATAARQLDGWLDVPLLSATEIDVPGGKTKCIRILLHVNTEMSQVEICHCYLHGAADLRQPVPLRDD